MAVGWLSWFTVGVAVASMVGVGEAALMVDYTSLVNSLFANYNSGIRPRFDDSTPTNVYIGFNLLAIQNLDEINQQLTFSCYMHIMWIDQRLNWTPASHNGIVELTFHQASVWTPDITIGNSVQTLTEFGFDRNFVFIRDTGLMFWSPGGVFTTSCDIDVTYYPFDSQECLVKFTTRISDKNMVDLNFKEDSVNTDSYSKSGTWDLVSLKISEEPDFSNYTVVGFTLSLKRLTTYYVVSIVAPVIFLSLTATLVFALPADSGEKMGTSITVLLAFAVYLTIVSDQIPRTSLHVSILAVWLTMLLGMTAMGVILTVWILNVHHREDSDPPGSVYRSVTLVLRRILCKMPMNKLKPIRLKPAVNTVNDAFAKRRLSITSVSSKKDDQDEAAPDVTWKDVAWTFDRFFFYFFTTVLLIVSVDPFHCVDGGMNTHLQTRARMRTRSHAQIHSYTYIHQRTGSARSSVCSVAQ